MTFKSEPPLRCHPHFADARGLWRCHHPPDAGQIVRIKDIALAHTDSYAISGEAMQGAVTDADTCWEVDLGVDLTLVRTLGRELEEIIINACYPRGHYWYMPPAKAPHYAFVREKNFSSGLMTADPFIKWDSDGVIGEAMALSRWVRPNPIDTRCSATLYEYESGEFQVVPGSVTGWRSSAYVLRSNERRWLDEEEAQKLGEILKAYRAQKPNLGSTYRRLAAAAVKAEEAALREYVHLKILDIVSGLEALFLIDTLDHNITKQFKKRVSKAAHEVGVSLTPKRCYELYELRSDAVHVRWDDQRQDDDGWATVEPDGEGHVKLCADAYELLRRLLVRGFLEADFAKRFQSDENINEAWPVD